MSDNEEDPNSNLLTITPEQEEVDKGVEENNLLDVDARRFINIISSEASLRASVCYNQLMANTTTLACRSALFIGTRACTSAPCLCQCTLVNKCCTEYVAELLYIGSS